MFLISTILIFFGCTKEEIVRYPDGKIKSRITRKRTLNNSIVLHGPNIEYWENGNIKREHTFYNGQVQGIQKFYFKNGNLQEKRLLRNTMRDGYDSSWYENGKLYYVNEYKDNKLHGIALEWDSTGVLRKSVNFENGLENGTRTVWYENGEKSIQNIKNGKLHGLTEIWHKNGRLRARAFAILGEPCGISYAYDTAGVLIQKKQQSMPCDSCDFK